MLYVNENTPKAYKEWMDAIKDTLDEKVEESDYHDAMIQKIFSSIEKDGISPTERYEMFEEYDRREAEETLKKKERKLIAKNLLALNLTIDAIIAATSLTSAEIENLPNEDLDDD